MDRYEQALENIGITFEVITHPKFTDPVATMEYLDITDVDTLPTLIMKAGEEFVVVLRRGDKRLDFKKLRQNINKRIRMATQEEFKELTGLQVGTARVYCPDLATYIDPSVFEKEHLFGGSGSFERTIRYDTASLHKISGLRIVDICL
jgi:prolyl-tRNA editing enzyme YbaK/EbsC (Cys-tRNA(Pro) deacylase)